MAAKLPIAGLSGGPPARPDFAGFDPASAIPGSGPTPSALDSGRRQMRRAPEQMVRRRREVVAACDVGVYQRNVAADHVEARVAQDPLEREHVATVDNVVVGECVAERVRRATPLESSAGFEALEDLLDTVEREPGSRLRKEDGLVGLAPASLGEIPPDRPARA